MTDYLKQIWLGTRLKPGSDALPLLIKAFGDADGIYAADATQIAAAMKNRRAEAKQLSDKSLRDAERILEFCASHSIRLLTYFEDAYPAALRRLADPPPWLFVRGELPDFERVPAVSIVGTRDPNDYSRNQTYKIAYDIATAGAVTVSGLALGFDAIAAAGTLAARGKTVAVLGCGIDIVYPKQHAYLARMVAETGCIISEFAPGSRPEKWHFPMRNRIIAALADAVLVTAGSLYSGSLITARHAMAQEKTVYALPGRIDTPDGEGPARLLRDGARLCASADDILLALEERYPAIIDSTRLTDEPQVSCDNALTRYRVKTTSDVRKRPSWLLRGTSDGDAEATPKREARSSPEVQLSPIEQAVYDRIPREGECHPDGLANGDLSISDICATLTMLEIYGLIETTPGGRIRRKE